MHQSITTAQWYFIVGRALTPHSVPLFGPPQQAIRLSYMGVFLIPLKPAGKVMYWFWADCRVQIWLFNLLQIAVCLGGGGRDDYIVGSRCPTIFKQWSPENKYWTTVSFFFLSKNNLLKENHCKPPLTFVLRKLFAVYLLRWEPLYQNGSGVGWEDRDEKEKW